MENEVKDISKSCGDAGIDRETREALSKLLRIIDDFSEEALRGQSDMLVSGGQSEERLAKGLTGALFRSIHAAESRIAAAYGEEASRAKGIGEAVREILLGQSQAKKEGEEGLE